MKYKTIHELAGSYINGNISYVKGKVKRMSKIDFVSLLEEIKNFGYNENDSYLELACKLLN